MSSEINEGMLEVVQEMDWISAQRKSDGKWMILNTDSIEWTDDSSMASRQIAPFRETLNALIKEFNIPVEIKDNPWPKKS